MKIFQDKKVELKPLKKTETYMRLKKCDAKQKSPEIKFTKYNKRHERENFKC